MKIFNQNTRAVSYHIIRDRLDSSNSYKNECKSDCNCDCACVTDFSNTFHNPSSELYKTSPLIKDSILTVGDFQAPYSYALSKTKKGGLVVLNSIAREILDHFENPTTTQQALREITHIPDHIIQEVIDQINQLGLIRLAGQDIKFKIRPQIITSWLHLYSGCNLRCKYCYLPHHPQTINLNTGRTAIKTTFSAALQYGYPQVKIKYAGGEPLLAFRMLNQLHIYAKQLAERNNIDLDGVVLTNGTLITPEILKRLGKLDLRLMISLDGLGKFHDCQRPYADGRGSAIDVIRSIEMALDFGLVPDISITITNRSIDGLPDLLSWVLERNLPFSLNFYRENDRSSSEKELRISEDHFIRGMLAAYKVIEENLPQRSLLSSLLDRVNLAVPHMRTCSVGRDYLVFDTQGRIAKCQMALHNPVADLNAPDPLTTLRESPLSIQNLTVDEKTDCKTCDWRYWCTGGCPIQTYRVTGRYDVRSPNCNIYRTLIPEVLRLEGLRLLKYAETDL